MLSRSIIAALYTAFQSGLSSLIQASLDHPCRVAMAQPCCSVPPRGIPYSSARIVLERLQALCKSEINFTISTVWDAGFKGKLGDESNGFVAKARRAR